MLENARTRYLRYIRGSWSCKGCRCSIDKDLSQICRCLGGAIGVIGLHPALLLFEQRYVWVTPAPPLVFGYVFQPGGHQHQRGFLVGERADDAGSAADLPARPLDGVVRPGSMLYGEVGVGERLGAALAHDLGRREQLHRLERVGHLGRLRLRRLARFLRMDGLEHLGDPRPLPPRHLAERVAVEVDGAPLVSRLGKTSSSAPSIPSDLSPVTSLAPDGPRPRSHSRNSFQDSLDSVNPSAQPTISRRPSEFAPMATIAATFS